MFSSAMQKAALLDGRPCLSFSLLCSSPSSSCSFDGIIRDCLCQPSRDIPNVPSVPEAVLHCHTLSHTPSYTSHNTMQLLCSQSFLLGSVCHSLSTQWKDIDNSLQVMSLKTGFSSFQNKDVIDMVNTHWVRSVI